jgi:hypothetical protein
MTDGKSVFKFLLTQLTTHLQLFLHIPGGYDGGSEFRNRRLKEEISSKPSNVNAFKL